MREGITLRRLAALAAGLAVALLLTVGSASPAQASVSTAQMSCEWVDGSRTLHLKLEAMVWYEDDRQAEVRRWIGFSYRLKVVAGSNSTDGNNVNIRLYENNSRIFTHKSPDDRRYGIWYGMVPESPLTTRLPAHDHRTKDRLEFEAVFDLPVSTDPRCIAWQKIPPG